VRYAAAAAVAAAAAAAGRLPAKLSSVNDVPKTR